MASLTERLDLVIPKIKEDKFLEGRGMGNEISFYVFDYDPKEELFVRKYIKHIKKEFEKPDSTISIIEFDLYELMLDIAGEMDVLDVFFDMEKNELAEGLELFCEPTIFIDRIKDESEDYDVIFITGVGKAFPFIRSHSILNNLMEKVYNKPLIMFYPGVYDELSLQLFGRVDDKNYYRAFRLIDMK